MNERLGHATIVPSVALMFWENVLGTLNDGWRYGIKPALMDALRNPDPVSMAVAMVALQPRHEKKLAPLHPDLRSQTHEAVVAAPQAMSATKKKKKKKKKKISPTAVERGRICVQVKGEMKEIKYMTRERAMNIKEIKTARPDFRFWDQLESDALTDEDRELALHPNRWEAGYPNLFLGKLFKVAKVTIRDYITAYKGTVRNKTSRAH